jgi:hypothetical protein
MGVLNKFAQRFNNNSDSSLSSVNWSLVHCMNTKTFFNKQVFSNFRKFISKVEL